LRRRSPNAAGAFTPVALVFLLGLVGGGLVNIFIPLYISPGLWVRFAGLLPLAIGFALFTWSRSTFRRHRTALMPWSPTSALVTDGPYRFSRNPIYLSFCVLYLGFALLFDSAYILAMLLVVVVLFDGLQIPREEGYLRELFGAEFDSYTAKVRRWL
jgi:protein-S-isoprenylcysteine O-methyltransferase Ste14